MMAMDPLVGITSEKGRLPMGLSRAFRTEEWGSGKGWASWQRRVSALWAMGQGKFDLSITKAKPVLHLSSSFLGPKKRPGTHAPGHSNS
jgi:hypothetical protein